MKDELFQELLQSIKEAGDILRSEGMITRDDLSNEEFAKLVGEFCFSARSKPEDNAAIWFIESVVLPENNDGYTAEEMAKFVLEYLKNRRAFISGPFIQ